MKLRELLNALGLSEEQIIVCGVVISARCAWCNRRFAGSDIVMVSVTTRCGYHVQCQHEHDRRQVN